MAIRAPDGANNNKVTFQLQNVAKFVANFKGFQKGGEKTLAGAGKD